MVGRGDPFCLKFWVNGTHIADFEPIFARDASAVTPSEKVQITLIGIIDREFEFYEFFHP